MSSIKAIDLLLIDDLFDMGSGYVLNFSDRTFSQFFLRELALDIDEDRFRQEGTSKAKRLRCALKSLDDEDVVRVLKELWNYREQVRDMVGREETIPNASAKFWNLVRKLEGGEPPTVIAKASTKPTNTTLSNLSQWFLTLSQYEPQKRGYEFEKFLKALFDAYGLEARDAFRIVGEQIDGSFQLGSETYLLEAKWQSPPIGAAELYAFHGKLENRASWARGLFISQNGFSEDGLTAFGKGKKLICMDGLDLCETMNQNLHLADILQLKVRRAAETGYPFVRVRDLAIS